MITIETTDVVTVQLPKAQKPLDVPVADLSPTVLAHIFSYGLRQILNDAMASGKTEAEKQALAEKRLANLVSGTLRASPIREGNPVRRRAIELASAAVVANPTFIAWAAKASLKVTSKDAVAKARAIAVEAVDKPGNKFTAQAELDVAAAKAIGEIEIEL